MKRHFPFAVAVLLSTGSPFSLSAANAAASPSVGVVYTTSNATAANKILIYDRLANGRLTLEGQVATGGTGTGTGLGNQGAVVLSADHAYLFAVNAGSNSVSSFRVLRNGLELINNRPSGGTRPVSLTEDRGRVYVLNAGIDTTPGNIAGFQVRPSGRLAPIANSTRPLSSQTASTAPAQIQFGSDGRQLIVTEKATNLILNYAIGGDGLPGQPEINASEGVTPFGFAPGKRRQLFVSEATGGTAGAGTLSSYTLPMNGQLRTVSAAVPNGETATCWVALTPDGRYAYTTNTGSGTISSYRIDHNGKLTVFEARAGSTGGATTAPIDLAMSPDGRFLFSLNAGNETISTFHVGVSGDLTPGTVLTGLPDGANGLAAR